ncbi:hypothetical protein DL98DRAFT_552736 [Cadophora sp. DSE1049]|nr:hypothetical protein DL98DRAFT_552736 [Cadophora sp. DSE1049]
MSALVEGQRVNYPSDLVSRGQPVKIKVVKIEGSKIGLSMKDINQETGRDMALKYIFEGDITNNSRKVKKRMTSPERWEFRQLIASGVVKASDYSDLDNEYNTALNSEGEMELEEDIDIELREEEPPFLVGQTKQSLELSPTRVVKAPDGSMNRAAMAGTTLAQDKAVEESSKVDLLA